jgi:hypothetical protein
MRLSTAILLASISLGLLVAVADAFTGCRGDARPTMMTLGKPPRRSL